MDATLIHERNKKETIMFAKITERMKEWGNVKSIRRQ